MWAVMHKRLIIVPVLATGAALDYLAWLGGDQHRDVKADGSSTGPYQAWHVVGLVVVLAGLAWVAGRAAIPWLGSVVLAIALSSSFAIDAATDPESDGLWPIGAFLVLVGSALGTLTVATIAGRRHPEATAVLDG